ncbi:MAG: hypothetical protein JWO56_1905, partial [Acidobacteria bacterium]|nr:hypothetical protein [Acidobacteriota bacterium]
MKEQLRRIYADLSSGRLSQDEALERIKAVKLQEPGREVGALLITPAWVSGTAPSVSPVAYAEHHVLLCERSAGDAETLRFSLPHSRCLSLDAGQPQDIAQRYSESATACFEHIRTILQGKARGEVLVQIVVPNDPELALLAGLSGLLKTAALENPRLIGQLILVPGELPAEELARLLEKEKTLGREPIVKHEDGVRFVSRWQEVEADPGESPITFKDAGVYLITGGLGGLGLLFAEEI